MLLFLLLAISVLSFQIEPCPSTYRRTVDCMRGETKEYLDTTKLEYQDCFKCLSKECDEGFSTDFKTCPYGSESTQNGWSKGLPCVQCTEMECPFGSEDFGKLECEKGYKKVKVITINSLPCYKCKKEDCPCGSSTELFSCPDGFNLIDVDIFSGKQPCKRCEPNYCPSGTTVCVQCPKGFVKEDTDVLSGFDKCQKCVFAKCDDNNEERVANDKVQNYLATLNRDGYEFILSGFSGKDHTCVQVFPRDCPVGYSINVNCKETDGYVTLQHGISEGQKCKKCVPKICAPGFSTDIVCDNSGYVEELSGYSNGQICRKCHPRDCPESFSTVLTKKCEVTKGFELVQSPIFEGEMPCKRCDIKECPFGTDVDLVCLNEKGYILRNTNEWSNGKVCKECVKKNCPRELVSEDILDCDISKGWKIEKSAFFSGDNVCSKCVADDCSEPYILGERECLHEGYEKKSKLSGGEECVWCKEMDCPLDYPYSNFVEEKCEVKMGDGYTEKFHPSAQHGTEKCFKCVALECPYGYSTNRIDDERGWKVRTSGYSGNDPCVRYIPLECPIDSFVSVDKSIECEERGSGWKAITNGLFSQGKECLDCQPKDCPESTYLDCKEVGYYKKDTKFFSGNNRCLNCIPNKCQSGYTTKIRDSCIEKNGYEILYSGMFSGEEECKKCVALQCPKNSDVDVVCDENRYNSIVTGKSGQKKCVECIPKGCPEETYLRDKLTRTMQRGYYWVHTGRFFSGENECGVYVKRECNTGYSTELSDRECVDSQFEMGWIIEVDGYSGRSTCKKCVKRDCPDYWVSEEIVDCKNENGYEIVEHEKAMSGNYRCVFCKPKDCEEGYKRGVICEIGYDSVFAGHSGGSRCVKCVKKECECNYSTFVSCPPNLNKECEGYSGKDECCRCI